MNKPVKIALLSVLGLFLLILGAAAVFVATFDPNDYKQLIAKEVQKATGRTLLLSGNVELSVFPWIGIATGPLSLSNPEGFTENNFLQAENAELHAQLRPLFNKELFIEKVVITRPAIALERNKQGAENWVFAKDKTADKKTALPASEPAPTIPDAATGSGLAAFSIQAVEVTDATVSYTDRQTGESYSASDINLTTGALAPGEATEVAFRALWGVTEPDIKGSISINTTLSADNTFSVIEAKGTQTRIVASGAMFPQGDADLTLNTDIRFDMNTNQLAVKNIDASLWDISLKGNVELNTERTTYKADILLQSPLQETLQKLGIKPPSAEAVPALELVTQLEGSAQTVKIPKLNAKLGDTTFSGKAALDIARTAYNAEFALQSPLRNTLNTLGIALDMPAEALAAFELKAQAEGTAKTVKINRLNGKLDDTTFYGSALVADISRPDINLQFNADKLNLDRYLVPSKEGTESEEAKTQARKEPADQTSNAPLSPEARKRLQQLKLHATIKLGQLQAKGFSATHMLVHAKADNGVLSIDPLSLSAYGGAISNKASIDVKPQKPLLTSSLTVSDVQVEEPLTILAEKKVLSGILNTSLNITGSGLQWPELASSLQGKGALELTQGVVHGVQIIPKEASSHLRDGSQVQRLDKAAKQQRFDSLTATVNIKDGKATNDDMLLSSYDLKGTGAGWADLAADKVDYEARLQVTGLPVIPVKITGSLTKPNYGLDARQFTQNILKGIGNLLKAPAETGVDTIEDVGGLLKQMFGRPKK
ncbi:AsmA family protein [Oleidesulfovibrio sp.]|uniref:AsmA family protein n=1 Tax=Oleidesulfovibrio sp. TaxID=2909707 RepID=UPI003A8BC599